MPNPALKLWHDYRNFPGIQARQALGPDLPVVRAGTATFEDWEQIVRTVASNESGFTGARRVENILLQSQTPPSSPWVIVDQGAINANVAVAPDGTTTADRLVDNNAGGLGAARIINQVANIPVNGIITQAFYAHADGNNWVRFRMVALGTLDIFAFFDLVNGVVGATKGADNITEFIEDAKITFPGAPDGWLRCGIEYPSDATDTTGNVDVVVADADNDVQVDLDGNSSILFWGSQLENVSGQADRSPSEYQRTITAPAARFYATNKNGGPLATPIKGRRIHSVRTNLCLQSNQYAAAPWTNIGTPIINSNSAVAPDGTLTADTINDNSGAAFEGVEQLMPISSAIATYTFSIDVKKTTGGTSKTFGVNWRTTGGSIPIPNPKVRLNTDTGEIQDVNSGINSIEDAGEYWRLITQITTNTDNTNLDVQIFAATGAHNNFTDAAGITGIVTLGGSQAELGAFPTNRMPTLGATVTRNRDDVGLTDVTWANEARGIFFYKINIPHLNGIDRTVLEFGDGATERHAFIQNDADTVRYAIEDVTPQTSLQHTAYAANVDVLFAGGYKLNDVEFYKDGVRSGTGDQLATMPSGMNELWIMRRRDDNNVLNGDFAELRYYDLDPELQFQEDLTNGLITEEDELSFVRPLVRPLTRDMVRSL